MNPLHLIKTLDDCGIHNEKWAFRTKKLRHRTMDIALGHDPGFLLNQYQSMSQYQLLCLTVFCTKFYGTAKLR